MIRTRSRRLVAGLLGILLVLGLSPLGTHLLLWLVQNSAADAGWEVHVEETTGSLLAGVRLHQLRAEGHGSWVTADTVALDLWRWQVEVALMRTRWQFTSAAEGAAADERRDIAVPSFVEDLPEIRIRQGLIDVFRDDTLVWRGSSLHLQRRKPWNGQADRLEVTTSGSLLLGEIRWRISTHMAADLRDELLHIDIENLTFQEGAALVVLHGPVVLDISSGLPLKAGLSVFGYLDDGDRTRPSRSQFNADPLKIAGGLLPLSLTVSGSFHGESPWTQSFEGQAAGRIDSVAVWLDTLTARVAEGSLMGSASRSFDGHLTGQAVLADFELAHLQLPLQGRATARGLIESSSDAEVIELAVESQAVGGLATDSVDVRFEARLANGGLQAMARSDRLGNLHAEGSLGDSGRLQLNGELDAEAWLGRPTPMSVQGTMISSDLDLSLETDQFPFGADLGALHARVQKTGDQLTIDAQAAEGDLVASALLDLPAVRFDVLQIEAHQFEMSRWDPSMKGTLDGSLDGRGSIGFDVETQAGVRIDSLQLADWKLEGPVDLAANTAAGALTLEVRGDELNMVVAIDRDSVRAKGQLSGTRLRRSADSVYLRGEFAATLPWIDAAALTLSATLDSASVRRAGWFAHTTGPFHVESGPDSFNLTQTDLATTIGQTRVKARQIDREWLLSGRIDSLTLPPTSSWAVRSGQAQFTVSGLAPHPLIDLSLQAEDLLMGGQNLGTLSVSARIEDGATKAGLDLGVRGTKRLQIHLTAPVHVMDTGRRADEEVRLQITAHDYVTSSNPDSATADSTSLHLSGQLDVSVPVSQLDDDMDWSHWRGHSTISRFQIRRPTGGLRLLEPATAHLDSGALNIEDLSMALEVDRLDTALIRTVGTIEVTGRLDTIVSNLRLRMKDIDLAQASRLLSLDADVAGGFNGEAVFTGTPDRPALDMEFGAQLPELGLVTMRVRGRPLGWNALAKWRTPAQDELTASLGVPPDSQGWPDWQGARLRLRSSGIEQTALLNRWGELDDLAGRVQVDLSVSDLLQPKLEGVVDVEALQLALLDMQPGYRFDVGQIRFDGGSKGDLVGFSGTSTEGSGRLELGGTLNWPTTFSPELDLHLLLDDVPYRYADIFDVDDVDADLTWKQWEGGGRLAGFLRLNDPVAQVQLVDLTTAVPPPPAVQNDLLEQTSLDLFIDIDDLQTYSEISDVVLDGGIRLYGTLSKPRFQGELDIREGHLLLLSRRFEFDRGRIITDRLVPTYSVLDIAYDPLLLDPELDLHATAMVRDNTSEVDREVTLELLGTARGTAPVLTSPGLGDTEVLNLLAFGDPVGGTASEDFLYAAAGQLLLSRQARRVGLDEFQLLSSGGVMGATIGEPSVRVGKYLDWPLSVWLRYEGLTRDMTTGQFEAEYRITNLLKIDARTNSDRGVYGVGIVLEKDF